MEDANARLSALLGPLTNYERKRPDRPRWSLAGMRRLLARPGFSLPDAVLVQVGGSKGKGTTALYLEQLAAAAGLRTGVYMSPHLESMLERVRLLGRCATEAELTAALQPMLAWVRSAGFEITFFEAMAAAALDCFGSAGIELGVLEVGLGGRLDATTAVPVQASIVTSIELEHTDMLGDTVAAIAGEKAHVIRPMRPAFTAARGEALAVLEARAAAVGADLVGLDALLRDVAEDGDGFAGTLCLAGAAPRRFRLPSARAFEVPAFALAAACLGRLYPDLVLPLDPVPRPLLPGRCELFTCADGQPLVLDAAHTEGSAAALATELRRRLHGRRAGVLFAAAAGKRWRETLKSLLPSADNFLVTALDETRAEAPDRIVDWLAERGVDAREVASIDAGLRLLAEQDRPRVVTGSFYLVGAARSRLHIFGANRQS